MLIELTHINIFKQFIKKIKYEDNFEYFLKQNIQYINIRENHKDKCTLLMRTIVDPKYFKYTELLINYGADINLQSNNLKLTALMYAVIFNNINAIELLLNNNNININIVDKYNYTALTWAIKLNKIKIIEKLIDRILIQKYDIMCIINRNIHMKSKKINSILLEIIKID